LNSSARFGPTQPTAVAAAPVLSSVVPTSGPAAGNNDVTLNGSGFSGVTAVSFGSHPALSYVVNSTIRITAVAPPGSGSVPVTVKTPSGTSNPITYTYAALPTLTSLAPSQGPSSGGTSVVLTGTGFSGATAVTFGSTPATGYSVNSATQITAVAPAGTGSVPVTVTTVGGTSNPVVYTYVTAPVITSLSPVQGPVSDGTSVTINGMGLTTTTAVNFGAVPASFTVLSDTSLVALAPAGPAGPVPVYVVTLGGTSGSLTYTRLAPPVI